MNKEQLQERIGKINEEMIQVKATYAKLEGHLGEAQHWLTDLILKETNSNLECTPAAIVEEEVVA
jgi:hypothetical protein